VRAVASETATWTAGLTAPFFVEIGGEPIRRAESIRFFADWTQQRMQMLAEAGKLVGPTAERWSQAAAFWQQRLSQASP